MKRVYTGAENLSSARQAGLPTGPSVGLEMGRTYITDFPWPEIANNNNVIYRREGNVIHVKGIKICRFFSYDAQSFSAEDIGDIEVNYCLLQLKNDEDNTELSNEMPLNFFRDNSISTQASSDFPTYGSTSDWKMAMNCLPINPNNKVNILTRMKKIITPLTTSHDGKNYWKIEKYFKIDKNFTFKNSTNNLPSRRIFEFYWYNTVTPNRFPADPTAVTYVKTDVTNTLYYGEPDRCCYRKKKY